VIQLQKNFNDTGTPTFYTYLHIHFQKLFNLAAKYVQRSVKYIYVNNCVHLR